MKRKITLLILSIIPILSLASNELPMINSKVSLIEVKTLKANGEVFETVKSYEDKYPAPIVSSAKKYFDTIDITKSDWGSLSSKKNLIFSKSSKDIIQEISIDVPILYEILLFNGSGDNIKTNVLLDKTISKQCERYIRHSTDLSQKDLKDYVKMTNMTTNRIVANLSNSNIVTVSFKCELELIN